jgi:hypothetical protein
MSGEEMIEIYNETLPGESWWISAVFVAALKGAPLGTAARLSNGLAEWE